MNMDSITIQDCIDLYEKKDQATIINDGKIVGFTKENSTTNRIS